MSNITEIKKQYQDKIEAKSIGQIVIEIRDGYDGIEKTTDLATIYKISRQMAVLQEIIDDYVSFALEMELDLDDPLLN